MQHPQDRRAGLLGSTLLSAGFAYGAYWLWPGAYGDQTMQIASGTCGALATVTGYRAVGLFSEKVAEVTKDLRALRRDTVRGSAEWLSEQEARKAGLHKHGVGGRFGGILGKTVLWLETETHQLVIGPAGSSKSSAAILPMLMSTEQNCLVSDMKGELYTQAARARLKKFGKKPIRLDPTDPKSETINPLDFIHALVMKDSPKALSLTRGMVLQLYPEPPRQDQNRFFRDGTRMLITAIILAVVVCCPPKHRNLASVYKALNNDKVLHDLLLKAGKSKLLGGEIALMANAQHSAAFGDDGDNRTFMQFKVGALQALEAFGPGNYLRRITSKSTFSFAGLKEDEMDVYIIVDYANKDTLSRWAGLMQWLAVQQMFEARNNKPINLILDEFCNSPLYSLPSVLTLLRSYGCKVTMATQDLDDIIRVYGKHALETIISETDVKQFLGGIRSKTTMEFLSKYMGEQSENASNFSFGKEGIQESISSVNRALLTPDEVRRLDKDAQIIFKGNLKPIMARKVPVFSIKPWRSEIAPNPMYGSGKRYLLPVEAIIGKFRNRVTSKGSFYPNLNRRFPIWRFSWFLMRTFFPSLGTLLLALLVWLSFAHGLPHIRVSYSYSGSWPKPVTYHWCRYWGIQPFTIRGGRCPVIILRKTW